MVVMLAAPEKTPAGCWQEKIGEELAALVGVIREATELRNRLAWKAFYEFGCLQREIAEMCDMTQSEVSKLLSGTD